MNKAYRSIYNEKLGTFVAVAENVKARGKKSSSTRKGVLAAAVASALALSAGGVLADVVVDPLGNTIGFTDGGSINFADNGSINFGTGGSITGLAGLTVNGGLTADQISTGGDLSADNISASGTLSGAQISTAGNVVAGGNVSAKNITATENITANGVLTAGSITTTGNVTAAQVTVDTDATLAANNKQVVTGGQLFTTNNRVGQNEADITTINDTLTNLGVDANKPGSGIKYFRANSTKNDAEALGEDSVAIGPEAKSEGKGSFAVGLGANAIKDKSIAVGVGAEADGSSSIALGDGAKVASALDEDSEAAIAIGKNSESSGKASTAIGEESNASGNNAIAFGSEANASGGNAVAFGNNALAAGANSVAMGSGAQALANQNISIGDGAGVNTNPDIAKDQVQNVAIGVAAGTGVVGQVNTALGYAAGQNVKGNQNVAFGHNAGSGVEGWDNISIGTNANLNTTANRAVTIGKGTKAATEGVAIGGNSSAGNTGVAVGRYSSATGTGTAIGPNAKADSGFVAIGQNSEAVQNDVSGSGFLTKRGFSGDAVSVGSSVAGNQFTRRIVNVEDGANATDAVNVRQLEYAVGNIDISDINFAGGVINNLQEQIDNNMLEYVSVNDGGTDKGNKSNNGAQAIDSIAIGPDATAIKANAVAIGHEANAVGESAVVLGHDIDGRGKNSTTIGNSKSEAWGESGIAIGTEVISRDENSIVIGRNSYTGQQGATGPSVKNSIVIGTESRSTATEGIVLGFDSLVNAPKGIAQGHKAHATAENAMAFGTNSAASGVNSQASGTGAAASGTSSQASGTDAKAYAGRGIALGDGAVSGKSNPIGNDEKDNNIDSIAVGTGALAQRNSSIATGTDAKASADFAQASGYEAEATGLNSIAQGTGAKASAENAIAQGNKSEASGKDAIAQGSGARALFNDSVAFGRDAVSSAEKALAFGAGAIAQNDNSIAIGAGAKAQNARSVALGNGATTAGAVGTLNASLDELKYGDFAGDKPIATVSVGTETEKRTITNVAAGRISEASTDAINGSQLYATNMVLGNVANSTKTSIGGETILKNDGTIVTKNVGNTEKDNIHDAIEYAAQGWDVSANGKAGENVAPGGSVDFSSDENINIVRDGTDLKFALNKDLTVGEGNEPGSIVVNGKDGKDGVSINGEDGSIGLAGTDGGNGLTLRGDQGVAGVAGIDGVTRIIYEDANGDRHEVATMEDGLKFAGNENPTDGYITRKLNEEIRIFGGAQNQTDSVYSSDNVKTVATQDGGIEIQFAETPNFQGADMGGKQITNVGSGRTDTEGNVVDKIADANPDNAANIGDIQTITNVESGGGFGLADASGVDVKKNLGQTIKVFDPDGNIVTTADNDKGELQLSLANDLSVGGPGKDGKDGVDGKIAVNGKDGKHGVTINGEDGSIGINGKDGANGTITVVNGVPGVDGQDGITRIVIDDIKVATMKDGLNFAGNTGDPIAKKLNETLTVKGELADDADALGTNLRVDSKDGNLNVVMAQNLTDLNSITINGGGPVINTAGINMGGKQITNLAAGTKDDDAVNVGQLEKGLAAAKTKVEAGKNIKVTEDSTDPSVYTVATEDDVEFDSVTSADEAGNKTVLNAEGITIAGPDDTVDPTELGATQITVGGENPIVMNGNSGTITGLTNTTLDLSDFGTKGRAATEEQLKLVSNKGLNFSGNYGGDIHKALGEKLEIIGDGEWIYTQEIDGKLHIKLAQNFPVVPNPDVTEGGTPGNGGGTGEGGDGGTPGNGGGGDAPGDGGGVNPPPAAGETPGNIVAGGVIKPGSNITVSESGNYDLVIGTTPDVNHNSVTVGGVVINQGGISMGGNNITNLAPGVDGKDAVNVDQLDKVKETAEKGWNVSTQGGTATQVKPGDTVDFANKDGNIVVANNGTNVTVDLAKDIAVDNVQVDNSVTVGGNTNNQTVIKEGNVTTNEVIIKRPGNPDGDMNVGETLNKGITFVGTEGQTERKLGETLEIVGANENITTKVNGPKGILEIALSNDLALDSVTINNGGPIINENGINMVDKRITNVAAGIDETDAVNVGQLGRVQDNLQGQVNHLRHDVRRLDKKLSAGVAAAMATAGLPQAYLPGKSMMAMSGGTWNGESGMAIGYSTITDSGKWVIKAAGNATGRGDYGGTVGVGYQW